MNTVVLLGPDLKAVSGVSTHLNLLFGSQLAREFRLLHFQVGSEGRRESGMAKLLRYLASPWQFWRFLRRSRPRIVHINTSLVPKAYWRDIAYLLVAKLCGSKVVYQVHGGSLPLEFFKARPIPSALLRTVLRSPDMVVLLSEIERNGYVAFDPDLKLQVVPNAVEVRDLPPAPARDPAAPLRLVYLGRLVATKGVFEAIEALALLRAGGIDAMLTFAGAGPDEARLKKRVAELGIADIVVFNGPTFGRDKEVLLQEADVLVLPSYSEGLPYGLLEAMAARTVPVVSPVGAIPEVLEDGRQGLLVPPRDPVRLAAALRRLHENRSELSALGEAARRRVLERYTLGRLAGDFSRIYRQV